MSEQIPSRKDVAECDKWDLSPLYASEADWNKDFGKMSGIADELAAFKGRLGESADILLQALKKSAELSRLAERVGHWAHLRTSVDQGDSAAQECLGKFSILATQIGEQTSFFEPEIQAIDEQKLRNWIASKDFDDERLSIERLLRMKSHVLSEAEERVFSLVGASGGTPHKAFSALTNVDIDYGKIKTDEGEVPLSQEMWSVFMENGDRNLRKAAYKQFYGAFNSHKNTLLALYSGSVEQDVFRSKARHYPSAVEAALFADNVPLSVYENLIATIRSNLAPLHKYYSARKRLLGLDELRHYDVYVPLVQTAKKITPFKDAVEIIRAALRPLGDEYVSVLCDGLSNGWCDKYENKGKRSGAFSSGCYDGYPYILLNYKEDVLRDLFTVAHEGGHSMHSWYSVRNNPFQHYDYTIFEAEVASTFNEELLFRHLVATESDPEVKKYLVATRASDILATLYRQTMFAEFELATHRLVESGTPLTVENARAIYRNLLETYFGDEMHFEEESDLEALRIPHFYTAFYVYKYATGISAALALAEKVMGGGKSERDDYFKFLKSGGSRWPIDSLKIAGVDMSKSEPVEEACKIFAKLVDQIASWT